MAEKNAALEGSDAEDNESLATENSDEEPLDGEPAAHVEAMLQRCLDPDERQADTDTWSAGGAAAGATATEEAQDEWGKEAAAVKAADGGQADEEAAADSVDSEAEDLEEMLALEEHSHALKVGLHELEDWGQVSLESIATPAEVPAPAAQPAAARARRAVPAALRQQFEDMRALQQQLRMLAVNQQALVVHYSSQLLRLSHAQADLASRHLQSSRQRHKQLRIVRRECKRLCACSEQLNAEVQGHKAATAQERQGRGRRRLSPSRREDAREDSSLLLGRAPAHSRRAAAAQDGAPRVLDVGPGGGRSRAGGPPSGGAAEVGRTSSIGRGGAAEPRPFQTFQTPRVIAESLAAGVSPRGVGGAYSTQAAARPRVVTPALATLQERECGARSPSPTQGGPLPPKAVPPEVARLVGAVCQRAAHRLPCRATSPTGDRPASVPGGGAEGGANQSTEERGGGGGGRRQRAGSGGARHGVPLWQVAPPGPAHDSAVAVYKPQPPQRKAAHVGRSRPPWQVVLPRESCLESAASQSHERLPDGAKQLLRHPAVQAVLVEAFWHQLVQSRAVDDGRGEAPPAA